MINLQPKVTSETLKTDKYLRRAMTLADLSTEGRGRVWPVGGAWTAYKVSNVDDLSEDGSIGALSLIEV